MRYFLLFFAFILILASCQKTPTATQSREDVLRSGTWKMTNVSIRYRIPYDSLNSLRMFGFTPLATHQTRQRYDTMESLPYKAIPDTCLWDNYIRFGLNNTASYFSGVMKCSISEPDSVVFSWYLSNNGNTITFINANNAFANNNVAATITNFSGGTFTIQYSDVFRYIDSPLSVNTMPIYHDTVWTNDTVYYNVTFGH